MSDSQPIDKSWEEWMMDLMLSSGQHLYAGGATVSGPSTTSAPAPQQSTTLEVSEGIEEPLYYPPNQLPSRSNASSNLDNIIDPSNLNIFNDHICYQCSPFKIFARLGDLTRHQNEIHNPITASKYLCPVALCPRGIQGEGFGRMHHLVSHLKTKKHGMGGREALHLARLHNLPKSKGQTATQGGA